MDYRASRLFPVSSRLWPCQSLVDQPLCSPPGCLAWPVRTARGSTAGQCLVSTDFVDRSFSRLTRDKDTHRQCPACYSIRGRGVEDQLVQQRASLSQEHLSLILSRAGRERNVLRMSEGRQASSTISSTIPGQAQLPAWLLIGEAGKHLPGRHQGIWSLAADSGQLWG